MTVSCDRCRQLKRQCQMNPSATSLAACARCVASKVLCVVTPHQKRGRKFKSQSDPKDPTATNIALSKIRKTSGEQHPNAYFFRPPTMTYENAADGAGGAGGAGCLSVPTLSANALANPASPLSKGSSPYGVPAPAVFVSSSPPVLNNLNPMSTMDVFGNGNVGSMNPAGMNYSPNFGAVPPSQGGSPLASLLRSNQSTNTQVGPNVQFPQSGILAQNNSLSMPTTTPVAPLPSVSSLLLTAAASPAPANAGWNGGAGGQAVNVRGPEEPRAAKGPGYREFTDSQGLAHDPEGRANLLMRDSKHLQCCLQMFRYGMWSNMMIGPLARPDKDIISSALSNEHEPSYDRIMLMCVAGIAMEPDDPAIPPFTKCLMGLVESHFKVEHPRSKELHLLVNCLIFLYTLCHALRELPMVVDDTAPRLKAMLAESTEPSPLPSMVSMLMSYGSEDVLRAWSKNLDMESSLAAERGFVKFKSGFDVFHVSCFVRQALLSVYPAFREIFVLDRASVWYALDVGEQLKIPLCCKQALPNVVTVADADQNVIALQNVAALLGSAPQTKRRLMELLCCVVRATFLSLSGRAKVGLTTLEIEVSANPAIQLLKSMDVTALPVFVFNAMLLVGIMAVHGQNVCLVQFLSDLYRRSRRRAASRLFDAMIDEYWPKYRKLQVTQ